MEAERGPKTTPGMIVGLILSLLFIFVEGIIYLVWTLPKSKLFKK